MFSLLKPRINKRGFTITEVIIVLAIAGVIMAVVLAVVPQAQRNQRDNNRKALAQRLMSSLENYNANSQGTYPFATTGTPSTTLSCATLDAVANSCYAWYNSYIYKTLPAPATTYVNTNDPSTDNRTTINILWAAADTNDQTPTWSTATATIMPGAVCSGSRVTGTGIAGSASTKQFAMIMALENSGTWYCTDNR